MTSEYDPNILTDLLRVAKCNGYRKGDVCRELGIHNTTLSGWLNGRVPYWAVRQQFPALIEKFQANPRVKPAKVK